MHLDLVRLFETIPVFCFDPIKMCTFIKCNSHANCVCLENVTLSILVFQSCPIHELALKVSSLPHMNNIRSMYNLKKKSFFLIAF